MDWTTVLATAAAHHGLPGVVALVLLRRFARSGPIRALAQVAAMDIRFRYLRLRGVPEDDRREWMLRQIDPPTEPEASPGDGSS